MFSASVNDADLSELTYLREHLSGAAKETIAGLHLSSSNYQVAQELLQEHFGGPANTDQRPPRRPHEFALRVRQHRVTLRSA